MVTQLVDFEHRAFELDVISLVLCQVVVLLLLSELLHRRLLPLHKQLLVVHVLAVVVDKGRIRSGLLEQGNLVPRRGLSHTLVEVRLLDIDVDL